MRVTNIIATPPRTVIDIATNIITRVSITPPVGRSIKSIARIHVFHAISRIAAYGIVVYNNSIGRIANLNTNHVARYCVFLDSNIRQRLTGCANTNSAEEPVNSIACNRHILLVRRSDAPHQNTLQRISRRQCCAQAIAADCHVGTLCRDAAKQSAAESIVGDCCRSRCWIGCHRININRLVPCRTGAEGREFIVVDIQPAQVR